MRVINIEISADAVLKGVAKEIHVLVESMPDLTAEQKFKLDSVQDEGPRSMLAPAVEAAMGEASNIVSGYLRECRRRGRPHERHHHDHEAAPHTHGAEYASNTDVAAMGWDMNFHFPDNTPQMLPDNLTSALQRYLVTSVAEQWLLSVANSAAESMAQRNLQACGILRATVHLRTTPGRIQGYYF